MSCGRVELGQEEASLRPARIADNETREWEPVGNQLLYSVSTR